MPWIQLEPTVWDHAKTLGLAMKLDVPDLYAAAHMAALWTWALASAPDGELGPLPARVIAKAARWPGDAEAFVGAAVAVGFLDRLDDGGLRLHGWRERHELWAARREQESRGSEKRGDDQKLRERERERKAQYRNRVNGQPPEGGDDGTGNGTGNGTTVGHVAAAATGSPSVNGTGNGTGDGMSRIVPLRVPGTNGTSNGTTVGHVPCVPGTTVGHVPCVPGTNLARPDRTGTGPGPDKTGPDRHDVTSPPTPRKRGAGFKRDDAAGGDDVAIATATDEDGHLWGSALAVLAEGMNAANYESYLAGTWAVGRDQGGGLVVGVGNPLVRDTLAQRFGPHVGRALYDVAGGPVGVRFVHRPGAGPTRDDAEEIGMQQAGGGR